MSAAAAAEAGAALVPLETLYESRELARSGLTPALERLYGGRLGFAGPTVYTNFVASLDGSVALPGVARSNAVIAAGSEADRFVMGLLRALADVVVIGSGTMHGSPQGTWSPGRAHPPSATLFAELRRVRGLSDRPEVVVLTGSGGLDVRHPALAAGALVLTSAPGAARLRSKVPAAAELTVVSAGPVIEPHAAVRALRARGHRLILFEAGPRTFGAFAAASLVDELFLTVSPLLTGGSAATRLSLVEGVEPLREGVVPGELLSLRRHADHLFLRYRLRRPAALAS